MKAAADRSRSTVAVADVDAGGGAGGGAFASDPPLVPVAPVAAGVVAVSRAAAAAAPQAGRSRSAAGAGTLPALAALPQSWPDGAVIAWDAEQAYAALQRRDPRCDGRLFVGVTSTGVYCRPVCRVRLPLARHCRFFATRAQAEAASFRPCLKCRPEIAPGLSLMDSPGVLAGAAARAIEQAVQQGTPPSLPMLAARLGITDRHLRRIFVAAHGVTPQQYLGSERLKLAKQLLTDTAQPVTQVALASGFASVRRFNAAFRDRYRLQPRDLRRNARVDQGEAAAEADAGGTLRLSYRPPYDHEALLGFFAHRPLAGVEAVDGLALRRTLAVMHDGRAHAGWIECRLEPMHDRLCLTLSRDLLPAAAQVAARVRRAFDLDAEPAPIDAVLCRLPLPPRPGLRVPGAFDGFETAVRIVLGQHITMAAAATITQRLLQHLGTPMTTPWTALSMRFPTAAQLAAADPDAVGRLGIVRQRVRALQALAAAVDRGDLRLDGSASLAETLARLLALPGIGPWTAQLVAVRVLGDGDGWPASDIGLMQALGTRDAAEIEHRSQDWRPWRGYALMRLWHSVIAPSAPDASPLPKPRARASAAR